MVKDDNKFNFFIPATFEKGSNGDDTVMRIKGIASSETEDSDGETLLPSGFDLTPLLSKGFLNYNHQSQKDPSAIIGEPTRAEIINNGKDLYIEGFLYPDSDEARKTFKLAQVLEKNSPNRRMGFSIEGKALEKDPFNPLRITKARITGIALTACPKNANTLLSIMKGEYSEPFIEVETVTIDNLDPSILLQEYKDWSNGDSHFGNIDNFKEFIKNNYEDYLSQVEELHKAITAESGENVWQVESINGGKKEIDELIEEKNIALKKSEVYSLILSKYSDYIANDIQKAKNIYQLIQKINIKKYGMTVTDKGEILSKSLVDAFNILDNEVSKYSNNNDTITKSEDGEDDKVEDKKEESTKTKDEDKSDDKKDDDKVEKSDSDNDIQKSGDMIGIDAFIKSLVIDELKKGVDQEAIAADLISKGLDSTFVSNIVKSCVEEMSSLEANGDLADNGLAPSQESISVSTHSPLASSNPIAKSEDFDLLKSELFATFEERQNNLATNLESRFKALGNILKSQSEQNASILESLKGLKEENTDLKKSLAAANQKIETFGEQPQRSRTITSASQVINRFANDIQKSQDGKTMLALNNINDMSTLENTLNRHYDIQKSQGIDNRPLANALFELNIAKTMDRNTVNSISADLNALNLEIV